MVTPYYQDELVTLYHGDALEITAWTEADVLVTDPPYGIAYRSNSRRVVMRRSIAGDEDTSVRDEALRLWGNKPALVFGSWKRDRPVGTHTRLIWDTKGALGMGNLSVPWKPSDQEIYVLGYGFTGPRTSNVLVCPPVQSMACNGRLHPHEKPVPLMAQLIAKCPPGLIADPFGGSGSTGMAARLLGRPVVLVEMVEADCETIARRLDQGVLGFDEAS